MITKESIFDNIEEYDAPTLLQLIRQGIVTFDELCNETNGDFPAHVRRELQGMIANSEDNDWARAKGSNQIALLEEYLHLYPEGAHREEARQLIEQIKANTQSLNIESEWNNVDKQSKDELLLFANHYPTHPHAIEAKKLIAKLKNKAIQQKKGMRGVRKSIDEVWNNKEILSPHDAIADIIASAIDNQTISRKQLVDAIEKDHNFINSYCLRSLIGRGEKYLTMDDIYRLDIDERFKEFFEDNNPMPQMSFPHAPLNNISKRGTEVYFWGIPASGKSCALGALLSVANNGEVAYSMSRDNNCQGYRYMTLLASLFRNGGHVSTFPPSTSIFDTFEMAFDLEDNERKVHPLIFVDMAGELLKCMYKKDADMDLTNNDKEMLGMLTNVLIDKRTNNRKIHFFVIEYEEDNKMHDGFSQADWLAGAVKYIQRTEIFNKDTNAIYILITKADKALGKDANLGTTLRNFVQNSYRGFYNGLKSIAEKYEINDGKIKIFPFTMGNVCFQDYCLFNQATAETIIKELIYYTPGQKKNKFTKAINILKQ